MISIKVEHECEMGSPAGLPFCDLYSLLYRIDDTDKDRKIRFGICDHVDERSVKDHVGIRGAFDRKLHSRCRACACAKLRNLNMCFVQDSVDVKAVAIVSVDAGEI